jgi:hypothetical protein
MVVDFRFYSAPPAISFLFGRRRALDSIRILDRSCFCAFAFSPETFFVLLEVAFAGGQTQGVEQIQDRSMDGGSTAD